MLRVIVTSLAQVDRGCLLEKKDIVRGMRRMTERTLAVIDRLMFCRRQFLLPNGVGVTLSAHIDEFCFQKRLFRRRVWVMAIETAYLVN